jgi:competence protein ComEA
MTTRIGLLLGAVLLAAVALWHPAAHPTFQAAPAPSFHASSFDDVQRRRGRDARARVDPAEAVVYVVGAVHRPGLYRLRTGSRAADAVARAGGLSASADASGVNLAARVADGDEIDVPVAGEIGTHRSNGYSSRRHGRSHRSRTGSSNAPIAPASVDVNVADAQELAQVPGIGRSIAARIVELREREGAFASIDELLDVAGMTQARLDRATPFLQSP